MINQPLVSVIINSYNGEKFISKSVNSALSQSYENFEIIFWDNKSTDNTEKIIKEFSSLTNKIKYFKSDKHDLLYMARKKAIEVANGEYYAILDVDDWWDKDKLIKQIPLFLSKSVGIVCSNYWLINERKNKAAKKVFNSLPQGKVLNKLLKKNFVGMSTLVFSKKAYESLEYGFNEKYEIIGDYDLVLRLSSKWSLASVQAPCSYYRWHGENLSIKKMNLNNEELLSWIEDMKKNKIICEQPNFKYLISLTYFYRGLILILSSNRFSAYKFMKKIKIYRLKFQLLILLFIPVYIIKLIRS